MLIMVMLQVSTMIRHGLGYRPRRFSKTMYRLHELTSSLFISHQRHPQTKEQGINWMRYPKKFESIPRDSTVLLTPSI